MGDSALGVLEVGRRGEGKVTGRGGGQGTEGLGVRAKELRLYLRGGGEPLKSFGQDSA